MPWMLEYNRKAPGHLRLPFEVWAMILDNVRDREKLAERRDMLVCSSRFSVYSDFEDLVRLYKVVGELDELFRQI